MQPLPAESVESRIPLVRGHRVMLANVLNSRVAVKASVIVVRAFIRVHALMGSHADLPRKVQELESKYDAQFRVVFDAIRQLMAEDEAAVQDRIGFHQP